MLCFGVGYFSITGHLGGLFSVETFIGQAQNISWVSLRLPPSCFLILETLCFT